MPLMHRLSCLNVIHGAVVEHMEGEEQRDQHDRQEDYGQLWTGDTNHQNAVRVRGISAYRSHCRLGQPPMVNEAMSENKKKIS